MKKPIISIIAAIGARNRVLGKDNKLLWNISEDMKHFRETTRGHAVIMGSKTFASLSNKPLPDRTNIVITRDNNFEAKDVLISHNIEEALEIAKQHETEEIFNIGGGQIYTLGLPYTDRLYLTLVDTDIEGDTYFPEYEKKFTKIISKRDFEDDNFKYSFVVLERG